MRIDDHTDENAAVDYLLIDIDGTLADNSHRGPFEWDKVKDDAPITSTIAPLLRMICWHDDFEHYDVVFISGRSDECAEDTIEWLDRHVLDRRFGGLSLGRSALEMPEYSEHYLPELHMRSAGDFRPDEEVKREIYTETIKPVRGRPFLVLDDRTKVVNMWRELGLTCWQVAEGNF